MSILKRIAPFVLIGLIALVLRAPLISRVPTSLYWEETILGYDALSLALTGKDHHGVSWPIVALESFGDWKPAGYVYAAVPFVWLFGLQIWTVRLPSLIAGLSLIVVTVLFAKRLSTSPWMAALVVVVSPWSIHFSRAAWEAHLATVCLAWGVWFAVSAVKAKRIALWYAVASVLSLSFAWYTYHAARLVVPLLFLGIAVYVLAILRQQAHDVHVPAGKYFLAYARRSLPALMVTLLLLVLCLWPLLWSSNGLAVTHRFSETSRFSDPSVVLKSNASREFAGNTLLSRVIYHRYVLWAEALFTAYVSNLDPTFLFLTGDSNLRHSTQNVGLFYPFEALFVIIGAYIWVRQRRPIQLLLIYWLLVGLIPSAISTPTPHALRILIVLPVFSLLIAQGLYQVTNYLAQQLEHFEGSSAISRNSKVITLSLIVTLYALSTGIFWFNYTQVYPKAAARQWQDGYQRMLSQLQSAEETDPHLPVYISRSEGRPASFLWFYRRIDPRRVQQQAGSAAKDQGEFLEFEQYHFVRSNSEIPSSPALIALTQSEYTEYIRAHSAASLSSVSAQNGEVVWIIAKQ